MTSNGSVGSEGECTTPGCTGVGHVEGARYATHTSVDNCPYSNRNLHRENPAFPDRLVGEEVDPVVQRPSSPTSGNTAETQAIKEEPIKTAKAKVTVKIEPVVGDSTTSETSSPLPPPASVANPIKMEVDKKSKVSQSIDLPVKTESEAELNNRLIQVELRPESPSLEQQYDSLDALTPPPKKM